jgi:hypothetical protein
MARTPQTRGAVLLRYPLQGPFAVRNSPADRVPSHGTELMGTSYAIDLVPVDARGRSAPRTWRTLVTTEPASAFAGFGVPVLAPATGEVVVAHDGEADHEARRSPWSLLRYAAGQAGRIARGPGAVAGNHVVVALEPEGPFVLLAHLRRGTTTVAMGDHVEAGRPIAACGNSGSSTEPHVHVQVTDSIDWTHAAGLPLRFVGRDGPELPRSGAVVRPPPADGPQPPRR